MAMKMFSPLYLSVLVLAVIYCETNAFQRRDLPPRRCYQCQGEECVGRLPPSDICPPDRPLCATVASAPNYTSSLTCAAGGENPCTLIASPQLTMEMTCTCTSQLCNAPFSRNLQHELIAYASAKIPQNQTDYIDAFWKQSRLVDDDETHAYEMITLKIFDMTTSFDNATEDLEITTMSSVVSTHRAGRLVLGSEEERASVPQAEALKKATTEPSDDDEDEGEGSGAEDEAGGRASNSPAVPAPSYYFPDDDNSALQPYLALLATIPPFFYLII